MRAFGAAVTQRLCGHWEHEGACRWPHRTDLSEGEGEGEGEGAGEGEGRLVVARVSFVCDADEEAELRAGILEAARAGALDGPEGRSEWGVEREGAVEASDEERANVPRNAASA